MRYTAEEIIEVHRMLSEEQLDIRSVTLSVNTLFAIAGNLEATLKRLESLGGTLERFVKAVDEVSGKYGIRIVTKRVAVSPIQFFLESLSEEDGPEIAEFLDGLAQEYKIDYVSGYSAFADRGFTNGALRVIKTFADALNSTSRLTGMINAASTVAGYELRGDKALRGRGLPDAPDLLLQSDDNGQRPAGLPLRTFGPPRPRDAGGDHKRGGERSRGHRERDKEE